MKWHYFAGDVEVESSSIDDLKDFVCDIADKKIKAKDILNYKTVKIFARKESFLNEFVQEIKEWLRNKVLELPNQITDFIFAVESDYQTYHNLDSDNWDRVHKPYFTVVHAGFEKASQREEIRIHAGENGNIVIYQDNDKLGFIIDVYGQTDIANTMTVWEEDLSTPEDDDQPRDEHGILTTCPVCGSEKTRKDLDFPTTMRGCGGCMSEWNIEDEVTFNGREGIEEESNDPKNFSMVEIVDFVDEWGQYTDEVCAELGYDEKDSDDLLMVDYFYDMESKKWIPKCASGYSEREQAIADYLRLG